MQFLDELDIRKIGERKWRHLSDFRFLSDKYPGIFLVPKGHETNLASIPEIFWRWFPPVGNYDEAAAIHDAGYDGSLLTITGDRINTIKSVADNLFYEALTTETLRHSRVGPIKARLMYEAVKRFGNYPVKEVR